MARSVTAPFLATWCSSAIEGKLSNYELLTPDCIIFLNYRNGMGLPGNLYSMDMPSALTLLDLDANC